MTKIINLINIGPKTEVWLREIGIETEDDLRKRGVIPAYIELKARNPQTINLMMLWAMQGALMGLNCLHLPEEIKQSLKDELNQT
ncbi:MAG: TfoX/Sxy family DNA transformation protein [Terasakiella sp.]|uniref:TfoX/Sxy family DNA transformation protein n=1 Tax=unclassified Terasakiella TaxID=2614952 RepID=UPI003B006B10